MTQMTKTEPAQELSRDEKDPLVRSLERARGPAVGFGFQERTVSVLVAAKSFVLSRWPNLLIFPPPSVI